MIRGWLHRALARWTCDEQVVVADSRAAVRQVALGDERTCGVTDAGDARDANEDAFLLEPARGLMLVADGMGGAAAGEIASAVAAMAVARSLGRHARDAADQGLTRSLLVAHRVVRRAGAGVAGRPMGAAVVAAVVAGETLAVAHVGDARAYLWSRGELHRLTADHSLVGRLVRRGELTEEAARSHARRNVILQAVGYGRSVEPEVHSHQVACDAELLLCTDGLWGAVGDGDIARVLARRGDVAARATALVDAAIAAKSEDNVTVVLHRIASSDARTAGGTHP